MLTRYLAHVPEVDAFKAIQKPNLVSYFVHKQPQFSWRREAESSKSFQEPQCAPCRNLAENDGGAGSNEIDGHAGDNLAAPMGERGETVHQREQ